VVAASCGQRGRRVERTDRVVDVWGVRTKWSPCRSNGPRGHRVERTDRMVNVLGEWTEWSPRRAEGVVAASCGRIGRRVVCTDRVVATSCGRSGHRFMHTDRLVAMSSVRTELSPCRADGVVAASCEPRGRRVECTDRLVAASRLRTAWSPCRAYGPTGCHVAPTDRMVTLSSVQTEWFQRGADRVVAVSCGPRGRLVVCMDALDKCNLNRCSGCYPNHTCFPALNECQRRNDSYNSYATSGGASLWTVFVGKSITPP